MAEAKKDSTELAKVDTEITYVAGDVDVTLNNKIIRDLICNGRKDVPDSEVAKFGFLCQARHLNPFVDCVPTVYGHGNDAKIQIVTTHDYYLRVARRQKDYRGLKSGVVVMSADGTRIDRRDGAIVMPGEFLVGAWCAVYVDGWNNPSYKEVSMSEYDKGNGIWVEKPATMIVKTAEVHALRGAYPEELGWVYEQSEMPDVDAGEYESEE